MLTAKQSRMFCDEMRQASTTLRAAEEHYQRAEKDAYAVARSVRHLGVSYSEIAIRMRLSGPARATAFVKRAAEAGYDYCLDPLPSDEELRHQVLINHMVHAGWRLKESQNELRSAKKRAACIAFVANDKGFTHSEIATQMQLPRPSVSYLARLARKNHW